MQKLHFDIYIGKKMHQDQGENIVAYIILSPLLPKGHYTISGRTTNEIIIGFEYLSNLENYICDWIDLVEDEKLITATIYLNKHSQHKTLYGKKIIKLIDGLSKENNRDTVKSLEIVNKI